MYDWAEFRHFRYLLAILEKEGFRAAAEDLRTAQPNLSVQARQFQENASIRLYRKTKSGRIRITETGMAFMTLARFLLETRQEVIDTLMALERGELGSLHLGYTSLADPILFRDLCALQKEIAPACQIRLSHGDTVQLGKEVLERSLDAALVTLPIEHPDLRVELLRSDRLVCCLRRDDPLAIKLAIKPHDLQERLSVLFHPDRHPEAHERLLELFTDAGIQIREYSCATHPSELQSLVREGYGIALLREGTTLDDALTTRPVAGVSWTVDMAIIYRRDTHSKSLPLLVKRLKRNLGLSRVQGSPSRVSNGHATSTAMRRLPQPEKTVSTQLNLLDAMEGKRGKCA
ncbi:LysR family transcriptional regulator [Terriglobus roseus]|uniref:DNA-binding transcriptional regulator, LysR family n=1 Tax=Terriglobus roseus TaxID=392734 RepID=A0A1G7H8B3_9BACT|nr:LysR family transcriptional regulator [Terriglobus roseus]SDE96636.1 DNA-binding transcriptional regulator, LysR family [Terriglobus roseus]